MVSPLHSVAYTYAYEPEGSTDQRDLMTIIDNKINGVTDSLSTYAYNYDELGNRKSSTGFQPVATYATNQLNQYVDPITLESPHDEDGNLETEGNWTYTWNNENRLSKATNSSTSASIDFIYDYQGRLVKKDDGTNVEIYAYNGWNRIATFDATVPSNFTLQTSYLWGTDLSGTQQGAGGVGGLLKEGDLYPTYDANGNIMQKLDGTGTTVMNVAYDPFGNIISSGTLVGEYGFSTKPLIDGLDWYYYGFRYYDAVTGRWPSRDPIEEQGGLNLYEMVGNDAVNWVDALGLIQYYENYGGPSWTNNQSDPNSGTPSNQVGPPFGPVPNDDVDDCYRQHDICHKQCDENNPVVSGCYANGNSTNDLFAKPRTQCKRACDTANQMCTLKAAMGFGPTGDNGGISGIVHGVGSAVGFIFTNRITPGTGGAYQRRGNDRLRR